MSLKSILISPGVWQWLTRKIENSGSVWAAHWKTWLLLLGQQVIPVRSLIPVKNKNFIIVLPFLLFTSIISPLFDSIPVRQSTRTEYRAEKLSQDILAQVHAITTEPEVVLQFIEDEGEFERVLEYVNEGNLKQYADKAFIEELIHWLRFNRERSIILDGWFVYKVHGQPDCTPLAG